MSQPSNIDDINANFVAIPRSVFTNQPTSAEPEDGLNLIELCKAIWAGKLFIIVITAIFAAGAIYYAKQQPDIYQASVLLSPVNGEGGGKISSGQLGGLASLAGISLGSGGIDKTSLALATINSRKFLENFILEHNMLPQLLAVKNWNKSANSLVYNAEIYNVNSRAWQINPETKQPYQPSLWQAYKTFKSMLTVAQNQNTSMVTFSIQYYSPETAKQWLTWLVTDINNYMRTEAEAEAKASINYLTKKLEETRVTTMETVFYQLIEEQTKNMMLTQVKPEYVLKTIDPAQAPEEKVKPRRGMIVILGTFFGGVVAVFIVLIRYFLVSSLKQEK